MMEAPQLTLLVCQHLKLLNSLPTPLTVWYTIIQSPFSMWVTEKYHSAG